MTPGVRDEADLQAIEAAGLEALLPAPSPYAMLRRAATLWPEACAIHDVPGAGAERRVDFATLFDRVRRAVTLFRRLGAGPDRAVAVVMPHTLHTSVALWAAERAGLACPINPMLNAEHMTALLRASRTRVAVVLGANAELDVWGRVRDTIRAVDPGITVLDADGDGPSPGSDGSFEALLATEPPCGDGDPDPDTRAALYPTGGTTGTPRLTVHTHRNQAFVAAAAARMYGLRPGDVMLNGFPMFHVAGAIVYGLSAIAAGATQLVPGRLGMRNRTFVDALWDQVARHRIAFLGLVPTILSGLLSQPARDADLSSLRAALTGGSLLPPELAAAFEAAFGIPVRNILGMTECAGVLTTEPVAGPRTPGATGLRLPFTQLRVLRPGTETPCRPHETGAVQTRGPHVSPGYLDPAAGPGTFGADGWLSTGDLGHQDEHGRLFLTGRAKDVIIRGAHNIDPGLIEDSLLLHPAVALAAAVGMPDRYAGELPVVFVTLHPDAQADPAALLAHAAARAAEPAARPRHVWIILAMPLTAIGKIYKPALRAEAARFAVAATLTEAGAGTHRLADGPMIGEVTVIMPALPPAEQHRLRTCLAGMPLTVLFETRE